MAGLEDTIEAEEALQAIYFETAAATGVPEEDMMNTVAAPPPRPRLATSHASPR